MMKKMIAISPLSTLVVGSDVGCVGLEIGGLQMTLSRVKMSFHVKDCLSTCIFRFVCGFPTIVGYRTHPTVGSFSPARINRTPTMTGRYVCRRPTYLYNVGLQDSRRASFCSKFEALRHTAAPLPPQYLRSLQGYPTV